MTRLNEIGASLAATALSLDLAQSVGAQTPTWLDFAHPAAPTSTRR